MAPRPAVAGAAARAVGGGATYEPLAAEGPGAGHCVAFVRSGEIVTAVTRLSLRLADAGGWRGTELALPPGRWSDLLAPEREFEGHARVEELFAASPVALLARASEADEVGDAGEAGEAPLAAGEAPTGAVRGESADRGSAAPGEPV